MSRTAYYSYKQFRQTKACKRVHNFICLVFLFTYINKIGANQRIVMYLK